MREARYNNIERVRQLISRGATVNHVTTVR